MNCEKCNALIDEKDSRECHGKMLCEDCYMVALSPVKACDPWAVYSAKSFSEKADANPTITDTQTKILKETGGIELEILSERLQLNPPDLEREIATLRHMEKVRAEIRKGRKVICLW